MDISSICAVILMRGLDFVRSGSNAIDYLAQIAIGNYRLLPYAIAFWIDHCSRYASGGGTLGPDCPLRHHLTKMHSKHEDCLDSQMCATAQNETQNVADTRQASEPLQLYSNVPVYRLMGDVLSLRNLVSLGIRDTSTGRFKQARLSHYRAMSLQAIDQILKPTSLNTIERFSADSPTHTRKHTYIS